MKVGRNDPCPCGSGKKYKQCCLNSNIIPFPTDGDLDPDDFAQMSGFGSADELDDDIARYTEYCKALPDDAPIPSMMEFLGRRNAATGVLSGLQSEMEDKDFDSIEELNEFFGAQVEAHNSRDDNDFLGLKIEQMDKLLRNSIDEEDNYDLISLNSDISSSMIEQTPVIKRVKDFFNEFIETVGVDGTLPLTATGRLKPAFCRRYYERTTGLDPSKSYINKADDYPALQIITGILAVCGYLSLKKTICRLTPKAKSQLSSDNWSGIYIELMNCFIYEFDWTALVNDDNPEDFAPFQGGVFFSLYILRKKGDGNLDGLGIYQYFYDALLKDFFDDDEYTIMLTGYVYSFLFFDYFCAQFGLIDKKYIPEKKIIDDDDDESNIKTTALFKELFKWQV